MKINDINNLMENDILPDCFNYSIQDKSLDLSKVTYNDYNSFETFAKKFTTGWQNIPGFDKVIKDMADNSISPLDEINERIKSSIDAKNNEEFEIQSSQAEWVDLKNFDHIFLKNI